MGDVHDRRFEPLVEPGQFLAHLHAQLGIQVAEGFVEQERLGLPDNRPAHGDALPLAPGQLLRPPVEQTVYLEDLRRFGHAPVDLISGLFCQAQAEGHILVDRHMRVQGVVLKDHGHIPVFRREIVDPAVADQDIAGIGALESRDHPERGRLAAARRTDKDHKLLVLRREADAVHGIDAAVPLGYVDKSYFRHSEKPLKARGLAARFTPSGISQGMPHAKPRRREVCETSLLLSA